MAEDPDPKEFPVTVSTFVCQSHGRKKCRHVFPHITVIDAGGVRKVMIDDALIDSMKFQCQECGGWNYHKHNEEKLEEQNEIFYKILAELHGQKVDTGAIIKSENQTG